MIISPEKQIYVKCPFCDRDHFIAIDPFSLTGTKKDIFCEHCGKPICHFQKKQHGTFELTLSCFLCGTTHTFQLPLNIFSTSQLVTYGCDGSGLDVCYIGSRDAIEKAVEELMNDLCEEFEEEFTVFHEETHRAILQHLSGLALDGRILCTCGDLKMNLVFTADSLVIFCESCGAAESIPLTESGLNQLLNRNAILLKKDNGKDTKQ